MDSKFKPNGSALETFLDLIEDPKDDGTYRLNVEGADFERLSDAISRTHSILQSISEARNIETARSLAVKALIGLKP